MVNGNLNRFDHSSQIIHWIDLVDSIMSETVAGNEQKKGEPNIFSTVSISPDGRFLLLKKCDRNCDTIVSVRHLQRVFLESYYSKQWTIRFHLQGAGSGSPRQEVDLPPMESCLVAAKCLEQVASLLWKN